MWENSAKFENGQTAVYDDNQNGQSIMPQVDVTTAWVEEMTVKY